ncbi:MAG: cation/multidrug efflux pump [Gammaproteobacteria bacterium]|nr:cation/multidrug efflux pump [Gammaproteobacteria bacterium]
MASLAKFSVSAVLLGALAIGGLGGLNLYTYQRFSHESALGQLQFRSLSEDSFDVEWVPTQGTRRAFVLRGDEWQLDVRMIKWTDWLTFLGEDPLYRLDRISGRYVDADVARSRPPVIEELADRDGLDVWEFARSAGAWLPGVDAAYGSSVFLPMEDGAAYQVSMTRNGLIARRVATPGSGS